MNAIAHRHFATATSAISIDRHISQVIPFPRAIPVAAVEFEPVAVDIIEPTVATYALVERALLTKAMDIVSSVAERRNTVPILSNAKITGHNNVLSVIATDMDIELTVTLAAVVDSGFATTLPVELLAKLLKKASKSDYVEINLQDDHATLDFERVDYRLQSLPVVDFPTFEPVASNHRFTMPGKAFWDGIDATVGAVSTEETRYYLNGIYFHTYETGEGMKLRMVATDGHRLYMQEFDTPAGCEGMPDVIVPRKTCDMLYALMKGKDCPDSVEITVKDSAIHFSFGDVGLRSKLIDGTFPDYNRVIPSGNDKLVLFEASTMLEAIESVSLISSERGKAVKLTLGPNDCRLTVNNPDSGSATSNVECAYDGDAMEIGFNSTYLTALIQEAAGGKKGDFSGSFADAGSPTVFKGARAGWTGVLMPMRV